MKASFTILSIFAFLIIDLSPSFSMDGQFKNGQNGQFWNSMSGIPMLNDVDMGNKTKMNEGSKYLRIDNTAFPRSTEVPEKVWHNSFYYSYPNAAPSFAGFCDYMKKIHVGTGYGAKVDIVLEKIRADKVYINYVSSAIARFHYSTTHLDLVSKGVIVYEY